MDENFKNDVIRSKDIKSLLGTEDFPCRFDILKSNLTEKRCIRGCIFSTGHPRIRLGFFLLVIPLQYECHNGDNDKDYYEPLCDIHGKPCYAPCTQYIGNHCQYEEQYCKFNQHFSP